MSLHDLYARLTPYELTFGDRAAADALLGRIDEEVAGRGADPEDPHAFVTMGAVADFVRELQTPEAPPGSIHQFGALVFHGAHFTRASCPLYVLSTHAARYLVEGAPDGTPAPPTGAGYVQLPQHLFWAAPDADSAPESVDGIHWTATGRGVLHSMLVTGLRPGRGGLAVVPMPEAPLSDAPAWLNADMRGDGSDFTSDLPGAEIDGLYAFRTAGEVFKLLARFFAHAEGTPSALVAGPRPEGVDGPAASNLPYTRVTLDG